MYVVMLTDKYEWYDPTMLFYKEKKDAVIKFRELCKNTLEQEGIDMIDFEEDIEGGTYEDLDYLCYRKDKSLDISGGVYISLFEREIM